VAKVAVTINACTQIMAIGALTVTAKAGGGPVEMMCMFKAGKAVAEGLVAAGLSCPSCLPGTSGHGHDGFRPYCWLHRCACLANGGQHEPDSHDRGGSAYRACRGRVRDQHHHANASEDDGASAEPKRSLALAVTDTARAGACRR
jgi:hypothetical protein